VGAGDHALSFTRTYNSQNTAAAVSAILQPSERDVFGSIGIGWTHGYQSRIKLPAASATVAWALRPNGLIHTFHYSGTAWSGDSDVNDRLTELKNGAGQRTGWRYYESASEQTETYDDSGKLLTIQNRNSYSLTLGYSDGGNSAPNGGYALDAAGQPTGVYLIPGLLIRVADSYGRTLQLGYDVSNRLVKLTDLAGSVRRYQYDAGGNLSGVIQADGTLRSYRYNEAGNTSGASLPNALTGIFDESGLRYATYRYDTTGRAIEEMTGANANHYQLNYQGGSGTIVTDPAGAVRTYNFTSLLGVWRRTGQDQPGGQECGAPLQSASFDANGNVSSRADFNGNVTNHAFDLARNLETSRTEGFGTPQARTISSQWHTTYRLPTQIDEPGRRTTYTHDANGNVLTRTTLDTLSNASRTWTYTYNSFGRVLTADGPRTDVSDTTAYAYYSCATGYQCGQVQTITNAAGHVTTYNTYNAHGQPLTITDPNGVVTTLVYDSRQRLTSRTVGSEATTFTYWPTGLLKKTTLPDGSYLAYTYDAAHRLTDINDAEGNRIHYTLDLMGNRTSEQAYDPSNALTRTRSRVFDALNRLQKEIGAAGTANVTTTFGYDNNGNQTSIVAPLGRDSTQVYDELNRLKQVTDPLNGVTQYGYNGLDQLISVTDPRNLVTSYSYNALGDLQQQTSPDTGVTTNTYDSGGNLATSTDARSAVATYTYDALNRVATTAFSSGSTTEQTLSYTYDAGTNGKGHLTGVSDANHSLSWTYDDQGRVLTATQVVGSVSKTTSYSYASGLRQSMTTPSGQVITYGYTNGKVTSVSVNGTVVVSNILYDPFGPVRQWTWADSSLSVRTFDQDGKVSQIDSAGLKTYSYDDAFRITGITDTTNSALSWTYGYDDLDRLTSGSKTGTTLGYTYDASGNRLTETGSSASTFTVAANSNRISSTSGALARTYGYDNAGNTTSFTGVSFTYNNRGRMSSSTKSGVTTGYVYNAQGQLAKKGTNTHYYYDDAGHILGIYDGSGSVTEEIVWLGDTPIATLRPQAGGGLRVYNIHTDHLSAPRVITDSVSGVVRWRWDGEAFGGGAVNDNPSGAGAFEFNLRFPGQIATTETGLYYNYYRDGYDPATGRYTQSDPIGLQGGLNTFAYALSNPLSFSDPLGLDAAMCRAALQAAGGIIGGATGFTCGCVLGGALGGAGGTVLGPGGTIAGAAGGCGAGGDIGGIAGAAVGGIAGDKLADAVCESDEPNCKKASSWQLLQAGILDAHEFKDDYNARPNSRFDICACKDGSIVIKAVGGCGKPGPSIPTHARWK
jgi:RHS repeat-associated protein